MERASLSLERSDLEFEVSDQRLSQIVIQPAYDLISLKLQMVEPSRAGDVNQQKGTFECGRPRVARDVLPDNPIPYPPDSQHALFRFRPKALQQAGENSTNVGGVSGFLIHYPLSLLSFAFSVQKALSQQQKELSRKTDGYGRGPDAVKIRDVAFYLT
jgi:hypothetical protein